jgi:hypothetical protein
MAFVTDERGSDDWHPELESFEPYERPVRSHRRQWVLRGVVLVAVVALVLPGIMTTYGVAADTADRACGYWSSLAIAEQHWSAARFEFGGPGVVGWECYASTAMGEQFVRSLGLIPVSPSLLPGGNV